MVKTIAGSAGKFHHFFRSGIPPVYSGLIRWVFFILDNLASWSGLGKVLVYA